MNTDGAATRCQDGCPMSICKGALHGLDVGNQHGDSSAHGHSHATPEGSL